VTPARYFFRRFSLEHNLNWLRQVPYQALYAAGISRVYYPAAAKDGL